MASLLEDQNPLGISRRLDPFAEERNTQLENAAEVSTYVPIEPEKQDVWEDGSLVGRQFRAGVQDISTAGNYVNLAWQTMMGTEQDQMGALDSMEVSQANAQAMASPDMGTFSEADSVGDYVGLLAGTIARSAPAMIGTAPLGGGLGGLVGKTIAGHAVKGAAQSLAARMAAVKAASMGVGGAAAVKKAAGGVTQLAAKKLYKSNLERIAKRQLVKRGAQIGVGPLGFGFAQLPEQAGALTSEEGRAQIEARMRTDRAMFAQEGGDYSGTILKVTDGDSVWIRDANGEDHEIRMADNQAADKGQLGHEGATNYLKQLLQPGQQVSFVNTGGKGKFGRELGHIYADGAQNSVNEDMLDAGVTAVHSAYATQNDYKRRVYENVQKGAQLYGSRHASSPLSVREAYTSTKEYTGEDPKSLGEMLMVGALTSAVQGTLELVPWIHGLGRMGTRMQGLASSGERLLTRMGKTAAAEAVVSGGGEAATEGLQTLLGQSFADYVTGEGFNMTQKDWTELWDAVATGFLVGGAMGGAGGLIRPITKRKEFGEDTPEVERQQYPAYSGEFPGEGRTQALRQMENFQTSLYNATDAEVESRWRELDLNTAGIYLTPEQREEKSLVQQQVRDEAMRGQLQLRDDIKTYAGLDKAQLTGEEQALANLQGVLEADIAEWENFPVEETAKEIMFKRHQVEELKIKQGVLVNLKARAEAAQAGTEDISRLGGQLGGAKLGEEIDEKTQQIMDTFGESAIESRQDDFNKRQEVVSAEVIAAQPLKNTITEYADITPEEMSRSESGRTVWKSLLDLRNEDPSNKEMGDKAVQANTLFTHQRDARNAAVKGMEDLLASEQRRMDATTPEGYRLSETERADATEYISKLEKNLAYAREIADQYNARFEQKYGSLMDEDGNLEGLEELSTAERDSKRLNAVKNTASARRQDRAEIQEKLKEEKSTDKIKTLNRQLKELPLLDDLTPKQEMQLEELEQRSKAIEETLDIYLNQQMIEYESEEEAVAREARGAGVLTREAMLEHVKGTRTDPVTGEAVPVTEAVMGPLADRMKKGESVAKKATALEKLVKDNVGTKKADVLKKVSNAWRALAGSLTRGKAGLILELVPYMGTNDKLQYVNFSEWSKALGRTANKFHSGVDIKWADRVQRTDSFLQMLAAIPPEDTAQVIKSLRTLAAGTYTDGSKTTKGKEKDKNIYVYNAKGTKIALWQVLDEIDFVMNARNEDGSPRYASKISLPALEAQRLRDDWEMFMPETFAGQEEGAALRPGERVQVKPRQVDERGFLKGNMENQSEVWASPSVETFLADKSAVRSIYQEKARAEELSNQIGSAMKSLEAEGVKLEGSTERIKQATNQVRNIKAQKTKIRNKIEALPSLKKYRDAINNIKQRTRMALKARNTEKVTQLAEQRKQLEQESDTLLAEATVKERAHLRALDKKQAKYQKVLDTFAEVIELRKAQANQERIVKDFGKDKETISKEKEIAKLEKSLENLRVQVIQRETQLEENYARARQTGKPSTTTEQNVEDLREIQKQIVTKEQRLRELQTPEKQKYAQGDIKAENSVEQLREEGKLKDVLNEQERTSKAFEEVENKTAFADRVISGFIKATRTLLKPTANLKKKAGEFKEARAALEKQKKKVSALQKKFDAEKTLEIGDRLDVAQTTVKALEDTLKPIEAAYREEQQQHWVKSQELPKEVKPGQIISVISKAGGQKLIGAKTTLYRVVRKTEKGYFLRTLNREAVDIKERQKLLAVHQVELQQLREDLEERANPVTSAKRLEGRRRRQAVRATKEAEGRDHFEDDLLIEQEDISAPGVKVRPKAKEASPMSEAVLKTKELIDSVLGQELSLTNIPIGSISQKLGGFLRNALGPNVPSNVTEAVDASRKANKPGAVIVYGNKAYLWINETLPARSAFYVMGHELGHAIEQIAFRSLDAKTQVALKEAFKKRKGQDRRKGTSYNEWVADKIAAALPHQTQALNPVTRLFARIKTAIKEALQFLKTVAGKQDSTVSIALKEVLAGANIEAFQAKNNIFWADEKTTSKKKRKPTPTPYTVEELSKDTYLEAKKEVGPHLPKDVKDKINKILKVINKTVDVSPDGAALIATMLSTNDSTGRMRGFRVAYHTIMSHDDKALLNRALRTKLVQRQVKLTMSKETWEVLQNEDPDVYLATVFDLWRADLLRLGPKTDTILGKILKIAKSIVGWVSRSDQSGQLLTALTENSSALAEKMSDIEKKLYSDSQLQDNKFQTSFTLFRNTGKLMNNILQRAEPPRDALRRLHIPAVDKIIDLFSSTMGVQNDVDYDAAVAQQKGIWHARLLGILGGKDQAFVDSYGHHMRTGVMPTSNAEMKKAVTETRALMKHLYTYLSEAGVQMDEVRTPYFPRIWNPEYIETHRLDFRTDLMEYMEGENGQMTKEEADKIIDNIITNEGVADPHLSMNSNIAEFSPTMSSTKKRGLMYKLAGSTPEKRGSGKGLSEAQEKQREMQAKLFDKYKQKDSLATLSTYVHSAIKKAEYSRRFGARGEKLSALLAQASEEGLSPENQKKMELWIESQMGIPRANINPKIKNAQGWALVGLSMAILPGIVLSSGPDMLGTYHRSRGDWQAIKKGYGTMIGELRGKLSKEDKDSLRIMHETLGTVENRSFSDLLLERTHGTFMSGAQRKTANQFFEFVGISPYTRWVRSGATASAIQFIADNKGSAKYMGELGLKENDITLNSKGELKYMSQTEYFETLDKIEKEMKEINTLRLKEEDILANALEKNTGITAAQKRQIDTAKKKIKALEKKIAPERKTLETDAKIKGAINRWVNAASMRPNPAVRPAYMNDPRFMLFSYLKDFIYSSYDVIGKQMYYLITEPRDNVFKGNAPVKWKHTSPEAQVMAKAMLMMGPMYFMGEVIRDLIQHGDEDDPAKKGWTFGDHARHSIKRAGIFGPGEFWFDAMESEERGKFIGRDYMGPVYGRSADLLHAMGSSDEGSMTRFMKKLLPGQALWKGWGIPDWLED